MVAPLLIALIATACAAPSAAVRAPATAEPRPAYCVAPKTAGELQDVGTTPASPYFVRQPAAPRALVPTIVFLPGGSGAKRNAWSAWDRYLAAGKDVDTFRVVVPYWSDLEITEDFHRTLAIVDEVLACYGGDPMQIHLGGFSNGGHAAFDLMLERPDRFATLLGAPGEFQMNVTSAQLRPLAGKAVFNGVGENDDAFWHKGVRDAHSMLLAAGVDSVYVEFPGQGHSANASFPKDVLFDFWIAHSRFERS